MQNGVAHSEPSEPVDDGAADSSPRSDDQEARAPRPRLLIISFSDITSDARVLKQVKSLAEDYEVTTLAYGESSDPRIDHVRLDDTSRIRHWSRSDIVLRRFAKIYWNQEAVVDGLARLAGQEPFDVILANDIDSVGMALALKPRYGVHADIHEYAPEQNREILLWRIFVAPFVRWMCRTFLPQAASMTTVGQGLADEYLRRFGVSSGVVTNAAPYAELTPRPVSDPIRLVHSGASMPNRRLEVLVDAALATTSDVVLDLYLMGNNPGYIDELRRRAGGSERVRFPAPVPYQELIARLNSYDVGLPVIQPTTFNERWALPNKFFDYVQARLGVVIGPSPEMVRILRDHPFGEIADGFDAESVTQVLDRLTPERIAAWKAQADASAKALSAGPQIAAWEAAIRALTEGRPA